MMMTLPARSGFSPRRRKSFLQNLYSRLSAALGSQTGCDGNDLQQQHNPLYWCKNQEQPPLLLIVPEHACRCGYSRCRGFIAPKYASDAKVDGDEALHLPYLYYFLRSDAKTGLGHCSLSEALHLMVLVTAAWTLGASVIP